MRAALHRLVVVALLLAGCGSDAEDPAAPEVVVAVDVASPDGLATPDAPLPEDAVVDEDVPAPPPPDPNFATAANGWYRGDLHTHTQHSDGEDDVFTVLSIADAYRDPALAAHDPALAGNGLDFIALTDHRTTKHQLDPAYHHDHLILLDSEEYGGPGHANLFGVTEHVPHEPADGQTWNERALEAVEEAHAQGALVSPNHPVEGINWVFDTPAIDSIEVWNGPWGAFGRGSSIEELDKDSAAAGVEGPYIRDAVLNSGGGVNEMALRFWYNHLTNGLHIPMIGGSDRHLVLPIGVPTTYVRRPDDPLYDGLEGKDLGPDGIIEGIDRGGTFVSRSPWGPQVDLTATDSAGKTWPLGAELAAGESYTIAVRVTRASGGLLRLVAGPLKAGESGAALAEPSIVHEEPIDATWHETTYTWEVPAAGAWLHAIVLEELVPEPLPDNVQEALTAIESASEDVGGNWVAALAPAFLPLVDADVLLQPLLCDPANWTKWKLWCMPADGKGMATFYIPDRLNRLMSAWREHDQSTDWCMGALTSAFLAR